MNGNAKVVFAEEVPEELIVYALSDRSAKAYTDAAEALREFRKKWRKETDSWGEDDDNDVFDLRYLYNEKEIWEERAELIQAEAEHVEDCWWYYDRLQSDLEYYQELKRNAALAAEMEDRPDYKYEDLLEMDEQEIEKIQPQFWSDEDDDWGNVRFVNNMGWVIDDYDIGHDEPNKPRDPYPPVKDERFLDLFIKEKRMKKCLDHLTRRAQRRTYEETRELRNRCRQTLMVMRSEPSCSFH